ncbi:MAG: alpha/beta hydrolase [Actinobacteria bacterium]|nr:alpha/beta hydrolase [Actinomycetota bacterium]
MANDPVAAWRALGQHEVIRGHELFTLDLPVTGEESGPPVVFVHGFPTSSYDWRLMVPALRRDRRVLALDLLGFGLSSKPDQPYRLSEQADLVQSLIVSRGLAEIDLVTHDMGDSVGGELLARDLDGELPFRVRRRVLTNGSIYIGSAHLRIGQRLLLALPDRRLPVGLPRRLLDQGLTDVFGPNSPPPRGELDAQWRLMRHGDGDRLMPRIIRYIRERQAREARFTGAIERHPAPCLILWGRDDPVALPVMAERFEARARAPTHLAMLDGIGHFPMVSAPDQVAAEVAAWCDGGSST